jgi:site-specific recombinase XerD
MWTKYDSDRARWDGTAPVRVQRLSDATVPNAELTEDAAFWTWAVIYTLRLTGVRIEELLELSHLSIRQYQRPNGEVIGLLVIAPSKTDRERVIPMSAELFHVIAEIIRRHTRTGRPIRLVRRWDQAEKELSEPLPFLFQRHSNTASGCISENVVTRMLRGACQSLAHADPRFSTAKFTAHDFRRLFATDLVNNGVPIHIGAAPWAT